MSETLVIRKVLHSDAAPLSTFIALAGFWIAGAAHELAHVGAAFVLSLAGSVALSQATRGAIVAAAGPAVSWALLLSVCWYAMRSREVGTWSLSIALASASRFVVLGVIPTLQMFMMGRVGLRNDEYRIATTAGIPIEFLLIGQFVGAVACLVFLMAILRQQKERIPTIPIAAGLILGIASWLAVAHIFDVGMMK